jgi:hypothetical protein
MPGKAKEPFQFYVASYLVKICQERAGNLRELVECIRKVSENSISYHAIQSLESHHYTSFSSDFSQWILHACNEEILAERLGVIDVRDFGSIAELRESLVRIIEQHLEEFPAAASRAAFETFYFCELQETAEPLGGQATDLKELANGIAHLSLQTLHYHLISSYMRPPLKTNDFSAWIERQYERPELANALNRIDFYTNTLEGVRGEILKILRPWSQA